MGHIPLFVLISIYRIVWKT